MYGERTNTEIDQIIILCVTEDGTVQEFVKDKKEYLPMLEETISEWSKKNETFSNNTNNVSGGSVSNYFAAN